MYRAKLLSIDMIIYANVEEVITVVIILRFRFVPAVLIYLLVFVWLER